MLRYKDGLRSYDVKKAFEGVLPNLERRFRETDNAWAREDLSRYQADKPCDACRGYRLKPESLSVKIAGCHIGQASEISIRKARAWFGTVMPTLTPQRQEIARLCDVLLAIVDAGRPYRAADTAFHAAICDATGNPMFGQLLQRMDEAFERSAESPFSVPGFGLASFPQHRNLADAIVAGDADAAEAALQRIIDLVEAEIRVIITGGAPR